MSQLVSHFDKHNFYGAKYCLNDDQFRQISFICLTMLTVFFININDLIIVMIELIDWWTFDGCSIEPPENKVVVCTSSQ